MKKYFNYLILGVALSNFLVKKNISHKKSQISTKVQRFLMAHQIQHYQLVKLEIFT